MEVIKISEMNILDELHSKQNENMNISENDLMLVRTQDNFPDEGIIKPIGDCHVFDGIYPSALKYHDVFEELGVPFGEIKTPKFELPRSTIHFCINGLVASHSMGNFSGRKYYIIEPLLDGLKDGNFISLNPEDSFTRGNLKLSDNAFICMNNEEFEKLNNEEIDNLKKFNKVYIYSKDVFNKLNINDDKDFNNDLIENAIVSYILHSNGYPYVKIGEHGFQHYDGKIEKQVNKLINKLVEENNLDREKHKDSIAYDEDKKIEVERKTESIRDFLMILIDSIDLDEERKKYIKEYLYENPYSLEYKEFLMNIIYELGLDKYNELVDNYNEDLINKSTKHK